MRTGWIHGSPRFGSSRLHSSIVPPFQKPPMCTTTKSAQAESRFRFRRTASWPSTPRSRAASRLPWPLPRSCQRPSSPLTSTITRMIAASIRLHRPKESTAPAIGMRMIGVENCLSRNAGGRTACWVLIARAATRPPQPKDTRLAGSECAQQRLGGNAPERERPLNRGVPDFTATRGEWPKSSRRKCHRRFTPPNLTLTSEHGAQRDSHSSAWHCQNLFPRSSALNSCVLET